MMCEGMLFMGWVYVLRCSMLCFLIELMRCLSNKLEVKFEGVYVKMWVFGWVFLICSMVLIIVIVFFVLGGL